MPEKKETYWIHSFTHGDRLRKATESEVRLSHQLANRQNEESGLARGNCLGVFMDPLIGDRVYARRDDGTVV